MSKTQECFKEGLLKKIEPNLNFADKSIKLAEHFLEEADELIDKNIKDMAIIAIYNTCFHAARALLYKDGVKERSHYCLSKYIEEHYQEKELITLKQAIILDSLREKRNDIQYSLEQPDLSEINLEELYNEAEEFIEKVKELLKKH